jgi:hypothetical protein
MVGRLALVLPEGGVFVHAFQCLGTIVTACSDVRYPTEISSRYLGRRHPTVSE